MRIRKNRAAGKEREVGEAQEKGEDTLSLYFEGVLKANKSFETKIKKTDDRVKGTWSKRRNTRRMKKKSKAKCRLKKERIEGY